MERNSAYRQSILKAIDLFGEASNKFSELKTLARRIRHDNIQRDYHEKILSINENIPVVNLIGYLKLQKSILENQIKFDNIQKELSALIILVLLYAFKIMDKSIDETNFDLTMTNQAKNLFYKCIEFVGTNEIENTIDLSPLLPIIVELEFKVGDADNLNKRNIKKRLTKLKSIIIGIE